MRTFKLSEVVKGCGFLGASAGQRAGDTGRGLGVRSPLPSAAAERVRALRPSIAKATGWETAAGVSRIQRFVLRGEARTLQAARG